MATLRHPSDNAGDNDRPSIDELVTRYRARLVSFIQRGFLYNRADAEDVAMEALEAAWRALDRFNPARARVSTWLFAIARNKAIDRGRAAGRQRGWVTPIEDLPEYALLTTGPESEHESEAKRLEVSRAIERLTDRERACVLGVYERGESVRTLMEGLGLSARQVRYALRQGMCRLRRGCGRPHRARHFARPATGPASEGREDDPSTISR
jgi:RNA polymerase sigma-70 factor (ECF subfamily)